MRARFYARYGLFIAACAFSVGARAANDSASPGNTASRSEVVVTASRSAQSSFDVPAAIDVFSRAAIVVGQPQINMSETIVRAPGVVAHNRQNYAQDLQISVRGFGARSTFGVRGVRVYVDGIPATMPDGQGQLSHIDLGSADRIEILRGPFSALYGNSSGGVISVFSEEGKPGAQLSADVTAGSYGMQREAVKIAGAQAGVNYLADLANFNSDGYRDHSAVRRSNFNSKVSFALDADTQLKIIANAVEMPEAQDPLGLTRQQFNSDAKAAGTNAEQYDTRKSVRQQQLGANYVRNIGADDTLNVIIYGGQRATVQYQSTPSTTQGSPANAGGVIDLDRHYWGSDFHFTHRGEWIGAPLELTAGLTYDNLNEARQGFQNFIGSELGVEGALRRDENNSVFNVDQYVQAQWQPSPQWLFSAGLRNSRVQVRSRDHYIVAGNGDDSGGTDYRATTPVLGATLRASDELHFYAAYGKGFETPTLNELAYKSTSGNNTGLNLALNPSRSEHYEIGIKSRLETMGINLALFHAITHDELAVVNNSNGRSVYQNVGKTQRDGIELSVDQHWNSGFDIVLAYTLLRAKYIEDFCTGAPCKIVSAGNRIPGVPVASLFGELAWRHQPSGFFTAVELHSESKLYVDDLNSDATSGYSVVGWRAGFDQQIQRWHFAEFVRVDNLTDRHYAGSVIVNESNARYFESAPGRNSYVGVRANLNW